MAKVNGFDHALFEKMASERDRLLEDVDGETIIKDYNVKNWDYYFALYRYCDELGLLNDFYRYLRERKTK